MADEATFEPTDTGDPDPNDSTPWYKTQPAKYAWVALTFLALGAVIGGGDADTSGPTHAEYDQLEQENTELEQQVDSLQADLDDARTPRNTNDTSDEEADAWDHDAYHANLTTALRQIQDGHAETRLAIEKAENKTTGALQHASNATTHYDQAMEALFETPTPPASDPDHALLWLDADYAVSRGRTAVAFAEQAAFYEGADQARQILTDEAWNAYDAVPDWTSTVQDHLDA